MHQKKALHPYPFRFCDDNDLSLINFRQHILSCTTNILTCCLFYKFGDFNDPNFKIRIVI